MAHKHTPHAAVASTPEQPTLITDHRALAVESIARRLHASSLTLEQLASIAATIDSQIRNATTLNAIRGG